MSDVLPSQHSFNHAPAALRIFRFAADSGPRVLELAHVSAFLRECAVEFGSADAALPGAMRCEYAAKRFFKLRAVVERNAARCPWLAEKVLACRSGAPMPPAALAPDVTRHDVNWGAEGARRHEDLQLATTHGRCAAADAELELTHDGCRLMLSFGRAVSELCWAQGAVGVTCGKHFFQVSVTTARGGNLLAGWIDDKISTQASVRLSSQRAASGAAYRANGELRHGAALCRHVRPCPRAQSTLLDRMSS
jgi:hypothetical protein